MKHWKAWIVGVSGFFCSMQAIGDDASIIGVRPSYGACLDATNGPDLDWIGCSRDELGFQDKRLNAAYRALSSKLPEQQRSELKSSERAWISGRDGLCTNSKEDGQGKPVIANDCAVVLTARRASGLEAALASGSLDRLNVSHEPSGVGDYGAFAPPGGTVYAYQPGFVKDLSAPGAFLVTTATSDSKSARSAEVFVSDGRGKLQKAVSNSRLIPCASCGGIHGDDPLSYIWVAQGRLLLVTSGGGRERWSSVYAFKYSEAEKAWTLYSAQHGVSDTATGRQTRTRLSSKEFGVIKFEDVDPDQLAKFYQH